MPYKLLEAVILSFNIRDVRDYIDLRGNNQQKKYFFFKKIAFY